MLRVENIGVVVARGKRILDGVSLQVSPGRVMVVIGPNGAGKSTLVSTISGVRQPSFGRVLWCGRELSLWSPRELACQRAVVAQSVSLSFPFRVYEVVMFGRSSLGIPSPMEEDAKVVEKVLKRVGMLKMANRQYTTLSGGERKRVHIARALAQLSSVGPDEPCLLVLDEPMASLDMRYQMSMVRLIRELAESGLCVVVVLHDWNTAAQTADHIAMLSSGKLVAVGPPESVLTAYTIERTYGIGVDIIPHPTSSTPIIMPRY